MRCPTSPGRRRGLSLIELLVVIAIIAVLAALLLMAVQNAREAANRAVCANNLSQMALAANSHVSLYGHYPTGGWGWSWVGDPDRGTNQSQPGGWIYNVLPFMEYRNIHDMGKGMGPAKAQAIAQRIGVTIKVFNCPTRARAGNPYTGGAEHSYGETGGANAPVLARADYAANVGDNSADEHFPGPSSYAEGDDPNWGQWASYTASTMTGITFQRSTIRPGDVTKGVSNVYLYGEKYLNPNNYNNGQDPGDNENMYCGMDNDVCRDTFSPPMRDAPGLTDTQRFGSAHRLGCNMSYCDGSVRWVGYGVDSAVHKAAGNRH